MGKYRLHNRLGSGGFAIEAVLAAGEIEFDYAPIDSMPNERAAAYVEGLSSWGQLPILELGNGAYVTEVGGVLTYLAQAEPRLGHGPHLWIDDGAAFHRWIVFLVVNVYEGILRKSYTERYYKAPTEIDPETERVLPTDISDVIARAVREAASQRVHQAFTCIERETGSHVFLLSDRMSPCDILLAMLYAWHNQKPDLPKCTWITTQVATHDVIRPIWKRNFERFLDYNWHDL